MGMIRTVWTSVTVMVVAAAIPSKGCRDVTLTLSSGAIFIHLSSSKRMQQARSTIPPCVASINTGMSVQIKSRTGSCDQMRWGGRLSKPSTGSMGLQIVTAFAGTCPEFNFRSFQKHTLEIHA